MSRENKCNKCGNTELPVQTFTYGKDTDDEEHSLLCPFCYADESLRIHEFRKHKK